MSLAPDIVTHVAAHFRAEERRPVEDLLIGAVIEDGTHATDRLLRCALVASSGSVDRLRQLVGLLQVDWRDVVVAGEYDQTESQLVRVRDLEKAFPDERV